MGSVHHEVIVQAPAETVWSALRDIGAIHTRLAVGFVTDVQLEESGEARIVTFGSGTVVREVIVDCDDERRRLAWSVVGSNMTHHNASAQVISEGEFRCRFVWIADFLPHSMTKTMSSMIEQGCRAIQDTIEGRHRAT